DAPVASPSHCLWVPARLLGLGCPRLATVLASLGFGTGFSGLVTAPLENLADPIYRAEGTVGDHSEYAPGPQHPGDLGNRHLMVEPVPCRRDQHSVRTGRTQRNGLSPPVDHGGAG